MACKTFHCWGSVHTRRLRLDGSDCLGATASASGGKTHWQRDWMVRIQGPATSWPVLVFWRCFFPLLFQTSSTTMMAARKRSDETPSSRATHHPDRGSVCPHSEPCMCNALYLSILRRGEGRRTWFGSKDQPTRLRWGKLSTFVTISRGQRIFLSPNRFFFR